MRATHQRQKILHTLIEEENDAHPHPTVFPRRDARARAQTRACAATSPRAPSLPRSLPSDTHSAILVLLKTHILYLPKPRALRVSCFRREENIKLFRREVYRLSQVPNVLCDSHKYRIEEQAAGKKPWRRKLSFSLPAHTCIPHHTLCHMSHHLLSYVTPVSHITRTCMHVRTVSVHLHTPLQYTYTHPCSTPTHTLAPRSKTPRSATPQKI